MAASEVQVQPDSTGKMIQTFANVIGIDLEEVTVQAQGVVVVDQTGVPVPPVTSSAALSSVAASTSTTVLLSPNTARASASILNDSASATLFLAYAATASMTAYKLQIGPGGYFELPLPIFTGEVSGIWDAAVGHARISEES